MHEYLHMSILICLGLCEHVEVGQRMLRAWSLYSQRSTKRTRNVNHTGCLLNGGDEIKYLHSIQKAESGFVNNLVTRRQASP